ncbi:MAG: DUF938 domain-containing protein [Pseudomonadota bacterium]
MSRDLPPSASVIGCVEGVKRHAPSAARNVAVLTEFLTEVAPKSGRALELASGTGQHVVEFAQAMPGLFWQPSDVAADRRASIDAYAREAQITNIAPALTLDAVRPGWGHAQKGQALIFLSNLLHLISTSEAEVLLVEAAQALAPGGMLIIYGPFMRDGALTSAGDQRFHAELQAADPQIGYKDLQTVLAWYRDAGLSLRPTREMPANNLALMAVR